MKKLIALLHFVASLVGCGQAPQTAAQVAQYHDDGAKIVGTQFLIAGQSNSVSPGNGAAPIYSQTGLVTINDWYVNRYTFRVPTASDPNTSGYTWVNLGDQMNREVFFNLVGNGGTSTRQWVEKYHTNIVNALKEKHYSALIWVQGESDAGLKISAEESYQNLKWIINESRTIQPDLIWYVALDGFTIQGGSAVGPAREAQKRIIAEGLARPGADLDAVRMWHPELFQGNCPIDPAMCGELEGNGFAYYASMWKTVLEKDME
jgi:hypothetical protein